MDIPRTYLTDVARVALAKVGKTEPHPLAVEQAIVDLQGVMNLVARNATDLLTTDFEQAAAEALAEMPLNEWLIEWRKAQKTDAVIVDIPASPEGVQNPTDAQTSPDDHPPAGAESGATVDTAPNAETQAEDIPSDQPAPTELEAGPEAAEPPKASTKAKAKNK